MGKWKMDDLPLPALFEQARKIHSVASESSVDRETLKRGIEALRRCDEMVSKLGLFSSNETKEDVSTTNLKYLLVPFYIAELTEKAIDGDRIKVLKISRDHLKEFLSMCEALELLPEEELESYSNEPTDFAARRAKKVARFKRQRAAEAKLLEIEERKERRGRSLRAAALSTPVEAGEEDLLDDGEEEREVYDLMEILKKEEEMLLAVKEKMQKEGEEFARETLDERIKRAEAWHKKAANKATFTKPAEPITCATFAQDVIEAEQTFHKHTNINTRH